MKEVSDQIQEEKDKYGNYMDPQAKFETPQTPFDDQESIDRYDNRLQDNMPSYDNQADFEDMPYGPDHTGYSPGYNPPSSPEQKGETHQLMPIYKTRSPTLDRTFVYPETPPPGYQWIKIADATPALLKQDKFTPKAGLDTGINNQIQQGIMPQGLLPISIKRDINMENPMNLKVRNIDNLIRESEEQEINYAKENDGVSPLNIVADTIMEDITDKITLDDIGVKIQGIEDLIKEDKEIREKDIPDEGKGDIKVDTEILTVKKNDDNNDGKKTNSGETKSVLFNVEKTE